MDYLYDGSFEGFLTAVYLNYYNEKADGIYPQDQYQMNLLTQFSFVATMPDLAAKVYEAIETKIAPESLREVYYVYLSDHPQKENLILQYLRLGFQLKSKIACVHTHPAVLPVVQTAKKVSFEAHRFFGLLRFQDAGRYLYAVFEPDHNILILLADHFADRLANENFIIHDRKRKLAVIYNRREWVLTELDEDMSITVSDSESYYQQLWTNYFVRIGIDNRQNTKLQKHFVPERYRQNLVEFIKSYKA